VVFVREFCVFRGVSWWSFVVKLWWIVWQRWPADGHFFGAITWDTFFNFIFGVEFPLARCYCWEAGEAVESEGRPLGLGRRIRNAATATTMMPMMTKTMSGLGKLVLLPGGLEGVSMAGRMRDPGLRFFGGGPSGLGRHRLFTTGDEGSLSFAGASDVPLGE
jgi:hypothetical protein